MVQRTHVRARLLGTAAAIVTVVAMAAGCGDDDVAGQAGSGEPAVDQTTTKPTTTSSRPEKPKRTSSNPKTTENASTTQPKRGKSLCTSGDLELSLGEGEGAAGTIWRPLRFTNVSGSPCEIQGFPGVSYVAGDDGHQVGAAAYRDGSKGAPVTLPSGATAYAAVGFTQVGNYDPAECEPTKVRGLRVYPPQETRSLYLANPGTGCANENLPDNHLKVQTIRPGDGPG